MDRVDPKVDEAIETLNMKDGPGRRKLLKGAGLVSATAAASALLAACSSSSSPMSVATASSGSSARWAVSCCSKPRVLVAPESAAEPFDDVPSCACSAASVSATMSAGASSHGLTKNRNLRSGGSGLVSRSRNS